MKEKVPFIEEDQIIGAFWQPGVGVVDSLRAGTIMRDGAIEAGALTTVPNVEVTGLDVEDGRITAACAPTRATSRRSTSSSPAACGARRSATWPA